MRTSTRPRVLKRLCLYYSSELGLEPTYRWIEKQVTSRRPPWAAAGR